MTASLPRPATSDRQIIGWLLTVIVLLAQIAVFGQINDVKTRQGAEDDRLNRLEQQDSGFSISKAYQDLEIGRQAAELKEQREMIDAFTRQKVNLLEEGLRTKQFALIHARQHEAHVAKALSDEIVKRTVP